MRSYLYLTCILWCAACNAADPPIAPLRGLQAFHIVIEPIDADAQAAGLTPDWLRKDTELRLQTSGISLVDSASKPEHATLSILVSTAKGPSDYAFHIVVRVLQSARLERAPDIVLPPVSTWEMSYIDNVPPPAAKMPGWVRPILAAILDHLTGAFHGANPAAAPAH